MEKAEFMSPSWIAMARTEIRQVFAGRDLAGIDYTMCEEFTNPPRHLRRPGEPTIGFYLKIDDGSVEVGDHPVKDAELRIVSDYDEALGVARDPDSAAANPEAIASRLAAGTIEIIGDPSLAPPVLSEVDIHRLLAPRTA
jgi:hypothetical protein